MGHAQNQNLHLSPEEEAYREYLQRGDDFFKIEILRPAKAWYSRALELKPGSAEALKKIEECDHLLKYEKKVFTILSIIGAVIIFAFLIS